MLNKFLSTRNLTYIVAGCFVAVFGTAFLLPLAVDNTWLMIGLLVVMLMICLIALAAMFGIIIIHINSELTSSKILVETVQHNNAEKPASIWQAISFKDVWLRPVLGLILLSFIVIIILWLRLSLTYTYVAFIVGFALFTLIFPFIEYWFGDEKSDQPLSTFGLLKKGLINLISYSILISLLLLVQNFDTVTETLGGFSWGTSDSIASWPVYLVMLIILILTAMGPFYWVYRPFQKAKYDIALKRSKSASKMGSMYAILESDILFQMRRYTEADKVLRKQVETGHIFATQYESMNLLGLVQMELGDFDEAHRILEGAIQMKPERGEAYDSLAEVILRQNGNMQYALSLAEKAIALKKSSLFARLLQDQHALAIHYANHAWILALLHRYEEAEESLRKTNKYLHTAHRPARADCYFRMGMANQVMGNLADASQYFQQAIELSNNGRVAYLIQNTLNKN